MKLKNKSLIALLPITLLSTTMPIVVTSCGPSTPTGDRTNSISWGFKTALITYDGTFSAEMDLEKDIADGQVITGIITSFDGESGGQYMEVKSVDTNGKKATVHFDYLTKPWIEGVDTFTVKFTGSTNGTAEWSNSITDMKVTFSK